MAGCPRGSGSLRKSKEEQPQQALCTVQRCGSTHTRPISLSLSLSPPSLQESMERRAASSCCVKEVRE